MSNANDVKNEVVRGLDKLIEIEAQREKVETELESKAKTIARLKEDDRSSVESLNAAYRMIAKTYDLDKRLKKEESYNGMDVYQYSFYGMDLFSVLSHDEKDVMYSLGESGESFMDLTDEELRKKILLYRRNRALELQKDIGVLGVEKSKLDYKIAALEAENETLPAIKVVSKLNVNREIKDHVKALNEVRREMARKQKAIDELINGDEKEMIGSAKEIQLLIKTTLDLNKSRNSQPNLVTETEEEFRKLSKQNNFLLDQQETIIRNLVSKSENVKELINIKDNDGTQSNRSMMAAIVLKLAALEANTKRNKR